MKSWPIKQSLNREQKHAQKHQIVENETYYSEHQRCRVTFKSSFFQCKQLRQTNLQKRVIYHIEAILVLFRAAIKSIQIS